MAEGNGETALSHGLVMIVDKGVKYAYKPSFPQNRVKWFEIPATDDLPGNIRLLESYERRLMHTADGGRHIMRFEDKFLDGFIEEKRNAFKSSSGGEQRHDGEELCIALLERGLRLAKQHMRYRINTGEKNPAFLKELEEKAASDFMEALEYLKYVRRSRGHKDVDGVLDEMKGEPFLIFSRTTEGKTGLEGWRDHRLAKAVDAMCCIDKVVASCKELIEGQRPLRGSDMLAMVQALADAAKKRLQLQHIDPDFAQVNRNLIVARDTLMDYVPRGGKTPVPSRLPQDRRDAENASLNAIALLREAGDLMNDIAIVRVPRSRSAEDIELRVKELINSQRFVQGDARAAG